MSAVRDWPSQPPKRRMLPAAGPAMAALKRPGGGVGAGTSDQAVPSQIHVSFVAPGPAEEDDLAELGIEGHRGAGTR